MLLGTCSCAVVRCVLCALSGFVAPGARCGLAPVRVPWLWPAACLSGVPRGPAWCAAPCPVRSLSVLRSAFPTPWCLSPPRGLGPPALLGSCAGHAEAGREPGSLCLPLAPAEAGTLGSLRAVPVRGPAMGLSLAGPSGAGLGLRALRWLACVDPVTDASGFPYRLSFDGGLGRFTGAVSCGRRHLPLRVGGRHARVPCVCACARAFWPGRAGDLPGAFWCASSFPLAALSFCFAGPPLGWGCPCFDPLFALTSPLLPLFCWVFFSFVRSFLPCAPSVSSFSWFPAPAALGLGALRVCFAGLALLGSPCALLCVAWPWAALRWLPPPPSLSCCCCCSSLPSACFLFFFPFSPLVRAPLVSGFLCFPAPGALGLGAGLCVLCRAFRALCFFFLPPLGSSCALACFVSPGWPVVVPRRLLPHPPPPPLLCLAVFVVPARCLGFFFSSYVRPRCLCLSLVCGPWCPGPWRCVLFLFLGLPLPGSPCALASCVYPAWLLAAPWWLPPPPPLPFCVSRFSSLLLGALVFFSSSVCPRCLRFSLVSGSRCPGSRRCALFALLACRFSALRALSPLSCFLPGRWLLPGGCRPPPPPLCLAVFVAAAPCCVPFAVLCCVSLGALLRRAAVRCAARCCAVVCCVALLRWFGALACCAVPSGAARRPGPCALRCCVVRCSHALCAVCSVLRVFCRGVVVRAVVCRCALCCVCPGVLCCAFPVLSARCGAVLRSAGALALCCSSGAFCCWRLVLWCAAVCCAVSFGVLWCGAGFGGPWLSVGGVFRCRCPCLAAWSASLWLAWFAVVPCFPVSCSVVLCCRVVLCCCALLSCCGAVGACFALLWTVVLCCVVLFVGCAVFCPVVVSACCGALSLVLCVPCFLRSVRCGALLCWLWCLASLCRVVWRCAVVWCCAVVFCCRFAVLFVCALPSCGLSCGAVLCCVVLLVVCAVFCPVVAFVCCGALSLPAGTHKKHQLSYVSPRVGGRVVAGMPWWLRCPGLDAAHIPPAAKGRRKRRGWGTGGRGRYMVKKEGVRDEYRGAACFKKKFSCFTHCW